MAGSIATVGGFTLVSRLLGFVRDLLIAATLGTGPLADAFFVALRLPNLFRALFAEGAFAAAFVPILSGRIERGGPDAARTFASNAASILLLILLPCVVLAEAMMPWLVKVLAPGFEVGDERFTQTVSLARITFPYLALVTMTAFFGSVLNSLYRFAAAAAAPMLLNLFMIVFLLMAVMADSSHANALAWGVLAGGVAQLVLVARATRQVGMRISLPRPRLTPETRRLGRLMVPGLLGSGVVQINVVVGTVFASAIPGAVSWLSYAHHLIHLPVAVVGVAVRTTLLPALSRRIHGGDEAGGEAEQRSAAGIALALSVPSSIGLAALAEPIVGTLFERGAFGVEDTAATARALVAYSLGLPAIVLVHALVSSFFARYDTTTPVKIALGAMVLNAAMIPFLMQLLGHAGIALAQTVSSTAQATALLVLAGRRGYFAPDRAAGIMAFRVLLASAPLALLGLVADPLRSLLEPLGSAAEGVALVVLIAAGMAVFGLLALVFGIVGRDDATRILNRLRHRRRHTE